MERPLGEPTVLAIVRLLPCIADAKNRNTTQNSVIL